MEYVGRNIRICHPEISNLLGGFFNMYHLERYESQWERLSHILMDKKKWLKPQTSKYRIRLKSLSCS